jgi:hypothetical protein
MRVVRRHPPEPNSFQIVRAQLREHGASTGAMPGRRIALNAARPLDATFEARREVDRMLVPVARWRRILCARLRRDWYVRPMGASSDLANECRSVLGDLPAGWVLTPVKGKSPYRPRWAEEPPVERELVGEEIACGHASGFAVRTGPVSGGIFAVDEDGPDSLALLPGAPGAMPPAVSVLSGRPGHRQRFFAVPEEAWPAIRNRTVFTAAPRRLTGTKLALRFGSMISCLPPSLHPYSRRYRWGPGLRPHEIENAPLPAWLVRHSEYESGEADSIVNAAWRGDRILVAAALRGGTAPDAPAPDGYTALQRAAWGGHTACAELLLSAGASPARPNTDPKGETPLILAAASGHTEIVGALLGAGARTADRDAAGRTALHAACWGGHAAAAELLVAAGADRWARDRSGRLPADEARRWGYGDLARWSVSRTWAAAARSQGAAGG